MGLVNHSIPNLIGGVSQQAASVRHPSQVEEMENMVPSVSSGLRRRAGTMHRAKLVSGDHNDSYVHAINRGTSNTEERYFVVIKQGDLFVYDYTGAAHTVAFPDGKDYLQNANGVAVIKPRETFSATSVADYTFIVNKDVRVVMGDIAPYVAPPQAVYVVVKVGVASTTYYVTLAGNVYSFTTNTTDYKTVDIQNGLATAINGGGIFTATSYDNMLSVSKDDDASFTWSVTDTYGDQALFGFSDQVNRYEQLPGKFIEGPVIKVRGDPNASGASFYVTWRKQTSTGTGVWVETIAPGLQTELSGDTMPHILVRESDNTFTFKKATWSARDIGDDDSNPVPSFVGRSIVDVFFWRNRLGFLADENVIMSKAADYFNFFGTSARAVTDDDPIDVAASTNKVTFLKHAIPFDKQMLVFSDKQQFALVGDPVLKPGAAKLEPTTAYDMNALAPPVALGRTVFFNTPRGAHSALREYYFDGNSTGSDAADTTAHVPAYLPNGVFRITVAPTEDMLFALTTEERNAIYVYNSYWNGSEKTQSAWHKWTFDAGDVIVSADVFDARLLTLTQRADGCYLDEMDLSEQAETYIISCDRLAAYTTGAYNAGQKTTFWTLPYEIPASAVVRVIIGNDVVGQVAQGREATYAVGSSVGLKGDYRDTTALIGISYASRVRLSEQFYRDPEKNAVIAGRLQLRDMVVRFERTGFFEARVYAQGRDMQRYVYSGQPLGLSTWLTGVETLVKGQFKVPIMANAQDVAIEFYVDNHLPLNIMSAEWQGYMAMQAQRR